VTLHVYRIAKRKYRQDLWDGVGGRFADGRWTLRGHPVVYAAGSISLAMLEFAVHYKRRGWIPAAVLGRAQISEHMKIETVTVDQLPADWRNPEPPRKLRKIGDDWLTRGEAAVLRVPSAIVPEEQNFLLNPAHQDFRLVTIHPATDFLFDRRLARVRRS
jgi:RES domain-containing protein